MKLEKTEFHLPHAVVLQPKALNVIAEKQVEDLRMYPSGSRGSPAKGVDWDNRCESSNLSIRANEKP